MISCKKPKVTIGVCVKNVERTIYNTLNSILSQDFSHNLIEIIIVDGKSIDETLKIIKRILKRCDIKSRIFIENKGLGFARQLVVENASGKYIVWVDGDMIIPNDFVRKQVEFMEKNPKVGLCAS